MHNYEQLDLLTKEELIQLIGIYSKNWLAMDGVWFQSVEKKFGMDEAIYHDMEAWRRFTVIEAKRIKEFLKLPENPGLGGLKKALLYRFYSNINKSEIIMENGSLIFRMIDCRVQTARERKKLGYHPCKPVGEIEYSGFAKTIDNRINCECISCHPDVNDETCSCSWRFTLIQN